MPLRLRSSGRPICRSTSSAGWPGNSVMTLTCVSVGSGNASTVRPRNAWNPARAAFTVKRMTAARLRNARARIASSMCRGPASRLAGQVEGVEEEERASGHEGLPLGEAGEDLRLPLAHAPHLHRAPLEAGGAARSGAAHEHDGLLVVGDH